MVGQVTVTFVNPPGLDDGKELLAELERETGVSWKLTERDDGGHLSVVATIVLTAVAVKFVDKATDKIADTVVDGGADLLKKQACKVIDRWKQRYEKPPEITIEADDGPGKDAAESPSAPSEPQG